MAIDTIPLVITRALPDELITEAIQNLPKSDQATLCQVSRLFQSLSLSVLNRAVTLRVGASTSATLGAFCSALVAYPARAAAIRSLTIRHARGAPPSLLVEQLIESMKLMRRLERLEIHCSIDPMAPKLPSLFFPHLTDCLIAFPLDAHPVIQFLANHPTITHLRIPWSTSIPRDALIPLPNLVYYDGPARLIRGLRSTQTLRAAHLRWLFLNVHRAMIEDTVAALSVLSDPHAPFISSNEFYSTPEDALAVLSYLAKYIPHTGSLQIRVTNQESMDYIKGRLPPFERLEYLAVGYLQEFPTHKGSERSEIQAWADAFPSLQACYLYDTAWRKLGGVWRECSTDEFRVDSGLLLL
ncbi:hypothetical protein FB45DRAFT_1020143 [Roridomyces roridus]|uniref:F-box domain-containing protein n=1 Tax=Roridomyces roridus TaxID=1738132 RepID=A0AAD7CGH4_9AGAR|nr:hypothetical protein FB45DRAFT_1020143 [Roridomyces roridus]